MKKHRLTRLNIKLKAMLLLATYLIVNNLVIAQNQPKEEKVLYSLDVVNDLLDTKQSDASRSTLSQTLGTPVRPEESIFSTHIITKAEINGLGASSIPEALRLVPGVLVKQISTGVYEIHLQTDKGIYSTGNPVNVQNAPFLLMVDFEPIDIAYNHRIAWESVPVSIAEIAQIEVIKTSQPTWYGSQAVSGVIHIIRDTDEWRNISVRMGSQRNLHADLKLPITATEKLKVIAGGHFNYIDKPENELYVWSEERYVQADSVLLFQPNAEMTNLFSKQSMRSYGGNLKFSFTPQKDIRLNFVGGANISEANLPWLYIDQVAESRRNINRYTGNFYGNYKKLNFQLLYQSQSLNLAEGYNGYFFNAQLLSSRLSYSLEVNEKLTLRPFISFRTDIYANKSQEASEADLSYGLPFDDNENRQSIIGGVNLSIEANEAISFFGGVNAEKSNLVDNPLLGFQLASLINIGEEKQLRIALAQTAVQPTLEAWKVNRSYENQLGETMTFSAGNDLKAATFRKADITFETPIFKLITLKTEAFYNSISDPIIQQLEASIGQQELQFVNGSGRLNQYGLTVSSSVGTDNFLFNAYGTWVNSSFSGFDTDEVLPAYTPTFYGGFSILSNFLSDRLLLAGTCYFGLDHQKDIPKWQEDLQILPYFSFRASYKVWQESSLFIEVKEIGSQDNIQHPFASNIPNRFLVGGSLLF